MKIQCKNCVSLCCLMALAMMTTGLSATETLARLLEDDEDKEFRQVGLVDAKGGAATFSGSDCYDWAGGITGKGYAIQGNIPNIFPLEAVSGRFAESASLFIEKTFIVTHDIISGKSLL